MAHSDYNQKNFPPSSLVVHMTVEELETLITGVVERAGKSDKRDWLTASEAVAYLGTSKMTLSRYEKRGILNPKLNAVGRKIFSMKELKSIKP